MTIKLSYRDARFSDKSKRDRYKMSHILTIFAAGLISGNVMLCKILEVGKKKSKIKKKGYMQSASSQWFSLEIVIYNIDIDISIFLYVPINLMRCLMQRKSYFTCENVTYHLYIACIFFLFAPIKNKRLFNR